MPYYIAKYVGKGTVKDPFRPYADEQPWNAIDLRPDASRADGGGFGNALLWLQEHDPRANLSKIADDKQELISNVAKRLFPTQLSRRNFSQCIIELLMRPPDSGWNRLRPSVVRQRYEVWLGPQGEPLITMPASVFVSKRCRPLRAKFRSRYMPLLAPSVQDPLSVAMMLISSDFACTDNASSLNCSGLTWTHLNIDDTPTIGINTNEGRYKGTSNSTDAAIQYETGGVGGANHYCQIKLTGKSLAGGGAANIGPAGRKASGSTVTFYAFQGRHQASDSELVKYVAGTRTSLGTGGVGPASGDVQLVECDGASITGKVNTVTKVGPITDSSISGNTLVGIVGNTVSQSSARYMNFDDFEADTLAAGGISIPEEFAATRAKINLPSFVQHPSGLLVPIGAAFVSLQPLASVQPPQPSVVVPNIGVIHNIVPY